MNTPDLLLSIISFGFNISTTIQLIKVIRTKSAKDFSLISLSWNVFAFLIEAIIFLSMGFILTAIPFFYACAVWGFILYINIKQSLKLKYSKQHY